MKDEFNFSEFAKLTGKDRGTISKRVKAAKLKPSSTQGGKSYYLAMEVLPLIYDDKDSKPKGYNPDDLQPQERQQHYAAELAKIKVLKAEGELVKASDVEGAFRGFALSAKEGFDMLPIKLEQSNKFSAEQVELIENEVRKVQSDLANQDIETLYEETREGGLSSE